MDSDVRDANTNGYLGKVVRNRKFAPNVKVHIGTPLEKSKTFYLSFLKSDSYSKTVAIWAILAIGFDFILTANSYYSGRFTEINPIVKSLTQNGILTFLFYVETIAILAIPLAFSNNLIFKQFPIYFVAVPHTLGALSWIIHQPFIVSQLIVGLALVFGFYASFVEKGKDIYVHNIFNSSEGQNMSNGGTAIALLLIGVVVGLGIGYAVFHDEASGELNSIISTFGQMSETQIIEQNEAIQITYPLLIYVRGGEDKLFFIEIANEGDSEQNVKVDFRLKEGTIRNLEELGWSHSYEPRSNTDIQKNIKPQLKGYGFYTIYLNEKDVGEIIVISY